ncbi:glycoside hydrolase family 30 beta sandwich domain-containing protein [Granulicella arctica]|uniref:Glucuronoarabinoxylan endo-1,4-beta-xylanase n=1 Tax=Granulicella arctica TaxID=940613 RepID=A0A7Y9PJ42_9BACT|nr:glycoside hydrolase family 30 beta sandwich domain-containing protein [Granulicella arctica]NYF80855.1 glucuronoarabinoxylan endo-1,4-beta-xylanase [Granulicella arctica]
MPVTARAQGIAYVDFGSSVQTIRGFGGSTAWMPELTTDQANALFSNGDNQQMGLSILRVRIDPGGSANWSTELANAQEAQARGASIIATPWTPPASMKSNDSTIGGTLNTGSYAAYATYLNSFATYMSNGGVSLYGISMQNEPDASVTYESCGWTGAQMDTWVADNASVLTTKLIMPESESFNASYSDPALDDSNAVGHISIVAGHLYGTSPTYYTNAKNKGKDVWMTEHYLTGTGISGALALAKEIHDSMTVADYNAYLWWWVTNWAAESYSNGLVDANNNVTLNGYAMGQYAKFVRPGYVRSNATYNPTTNIYVSAYKGSGHYVIVALNLGTSAVSQPFTIQNESVTSLIPYETSASESMTQLSTVGVSNDTFTYTLPAQSITTFVH